MSILIFSRHYLVVVVLTHIIYIFHFWTEGLFSIWEPTIQWSVRSAFLRSGNSNLNDVGKSETDLICTLVGRDIYIDV